MILIGFLLVIVMILCVIFRDGYENRPQVGIDKIKLFYFFGDKDDEV